MTRRPRFITRAQWGADGSLRNCDPYYAPVVKMGFVHHTAGVNTYSESESDDILRAILAYHTNGRGWCDIAYNFLVDRFGNVYEGRAGGMDLPVVGAATQGFNTGSFSVAVMGDFETVPPSTAAVRALRRVLTWRLDVAHLPPRGWADMVSGGGDDTRYPAGAQVTLSVLSGHRDTGYTDCPGGRLYALLPGIRRAVAGMGLPKIYRPTLTPSSLVGGIPQDIRIRARGSEPLDWTVTVVDAVGSVVAALPPQSGGPLDLRWPALGGPPQPTLPGVYRVVVAGQAPDGRVARAASVPLAVAIVPSPSASPTVGPTASPSPSPTVSPTP